MTVSLIGNAKKDVNAACSRKFRPRAILGDRLDAFGAAAG